MARVQKLENNAMTIKYNKYNPKVTFGNDLFDRENIFLFRKFFDLLHHYLFDCNLMTYDIKIYCSNIYCLQTTHSQYFCSIVYKIPYDSSF